MGNRKLPFGYKMVMGEIVIHPQAVSYTHLTLPTSDLV